LRQAKELAVAYLKLTGKPLGIAGEIAEYEAAEKLGLVMADARTAFSMHSGSRGKTGERLSRSKVGRFHRTTVIEDTCQDQNAVENWCGSPGSA